MVGSFGQIDEPAISQLDSECSWFERYRDVDLEKNVLRTGTDIVGVAAETATVARRERLPGSPRRTSDGSLWIPADLSDALPVPPVVDVGVRRSGVLWRIRCTRRVTFLPGVVARVSSQLVRLLVELDGSDPAAVAQVLRRLVGRDLSMVDGVADLLSPSPARSRLDGDTLPPAAASILAYVRSREPGTVHEIEFTKQGAESVIGRLVGLRLVRRLSSGQIIDETQYQELLERLPRLPSGFASRDAADLWHTSHGFALAALAEMVNDDQVTAEPGKHYRVRE